MFGLRKGSLRSMLEQVKILTSRKAYEFRIDDIRLSMLSTKPIQEQLQQLLHFQSSTIGTPMPTFGEVPVTYPPGLVFNMGTWFSPDGQIVPIRFLHFEQRRIVIDVAGTSSAIDAIYEIVREYLSRLHATDGSSIIGELERMLDYSEITAHFPFPVNSFLPQPLQQVYAEYGHHSDDNHLVQIPTLIMQSHSSIQDFKGVDVNSNLAFTFTLRAGTRVSELIYFSAAPLNSDLHLAYLTKLESALQALH